MPASAAAERNDTVASVNPLEMIRLELQGRVRSLLTGSAEAPPRLQTRSASDDGLFGPASVTWVVHSDASMLVGGLRALLLQTMHPQAMAGVADHSGYRADPLGRLHRTSTYVGITSFGTRSQAEAAVRQVRSVHGRVQGTAPDGRAYAANDPHLLGWVHHTLVDSFLRAYERFGQHPLTAADADRYVAEQSVLADLIGAKDPAPATTKAELRAWMAGIRPELGADRRAREAARFLLFPPLPTPVLPAFAITASAAAGLLPVWVRRDLWIPTVPLADAIVVRPVARAMTRAIDWVLQAPHAGNSRPTTRVGRDSFGPSPGGTA